MRIFSNRREGVTWDKIFPKERDDEPPGLHPKKEGLMSLRPNSS